MVLVDGFSTKQNQESPMDFCKNWAWGQHLVMKVFNQQFCNLVVGIQHKDVLLKDRTPLPCVDDEATRTASLAQLQHLSINAVCDHVVSMSITSKHFQKNNVQNLLSSEHT